MLRQTSRITISKTISKSILPAPVSFHRGNSLKCTTASPSVSRTQFSTHSVQFEEETTEKKPTRGYVIRKCMNRVNLIGFVGAEPTVKETTNGKVIFFPLATTSSKKTTWHRIQCFQEESFDDIFSKVKKGEYIHIEGSISNSKTKDGVQIFGITIRSTYNVTVLGSKLANRPIDQEAEQ